MRWRCGACYCYHCSCRRGIVLLVVEGAGGVGDTLLLLLTSVSEHLLMLVLRSRSGLLWVMVSDGAVSAFVAVVAH
jgi:hypothetical protein